MRLEDDDVVDHQGNQHHHHFQLIVNPEEHWAWHQAQYAAVDEVLEVNMVREKPWIWHEALFSFFKILNSFPIEEIWIF